MVGETYRVPPPQVEIPPAGEVWKETQENLLDTIPTWSPLKEVYPRRILTGLWEQQWFWEFGLSYGF